MRRSIRPKCAGYVGRDIADGDCKRLGEECVDSDCSLGIDSMKSLRSGTRGTLEGRAARKWFCGVPDRGRAESSASTDWRPHKQGRYITAASSAAESFPLRSGQLYSLVSGFRPYHWNPLAWFPFIVMTCTSAIATLSKSDVSVSIQARSWWRSTAPSGSSNTP